MIFTPFANIYVLVFQDELMAELEDLEQEELDRALIDVGPAADELPSVPTAEPAAASKGQFQLASLF